MKKTCAVLWLAAFVAQAFAAKVDRVLVRQQWPWSSEVRVEYSVSGTEYPAAVSFTFYDGESELTPTDMTALKGDTAYAGNGLHIVTFDPKALFGISDTQQFSNFRVKVTLGEESALMSDKLYRIIDLDTGKITDLVRADFYNNKGYGTFETDFSVFGSGGWNTSLKNVLIWTGVTNNPIYKTSKIVMRYITAKDQTFTMGDDDYANGSPAHQVTLTNDYYLSVFEITQAQLYKLTGGYGSKSTTVDGHELLPAMGRYYILWGRAATWPADEHKGVMSGFLSAMRNLSSKKILFDFPTEAQWEFACRAGTSTQFYTGLSSVDADRSLLGYRISNGETGVDHPTKVGSFLPNAFGLYDMYCNTAEWCLDWFGSYTEEDKVEPVGLTSGNLRTIRGAHFSTKHSVKGNATVWRGGVTPGGGSNLYGCRLWCPAE